ncbi:MAG: hypothetical protein QMD92_04760 [bacterium]|nr:hypothetical protein [bacterium]
MWRMHEGSTSWGEKYKIQALYDDAEVLRRMLKIFTLKELFPTIEWNNISKEVGKALAFNNIASIFSARNAYKDAIRYYQQSIAEIPNEKAFFYMGINYAKISEADNAIKHIKKAQELNPQLLSNTENIEVLRDLDDKIVGDIIEKI